MKAISKSVAFFTAVVLLLLWIETRAPLCSGDQAGAWLANHCRVTPAWQYLLYDLAAVAFFVVLMRGGRAVRNNHTKRG
jgi:hypothetical protein